ncbi:MAG TPA: hypothetical protein PLR45_10740, partial [Flavobacteriales bacterium]|nr:hypothetical protein [Flavobacteriales bacterium]
LRWKLPVQGDCAEDSSALSNSRTSGIRFISGYKVTKVGTELEGRPLISFVEAFSTIFWVYLKKSL